MIIKVTIKPNSKKGPLLETQTDASIIVYVREIAADNKANEALIKMLAKHFNISKSNITIVRGHTSRHKLIELTL